MWGILSSLGAGAPRPPRQVLVLLSQDSVQSPCPEAAIRGQGHSGLGLTVCRWEGPAIWMKSSHVRSNPHPQYHHHHHPHGHRASRRGSGRRALTRVLAWETTFTPGSSPLGLPRRLHGKDSACQCRKGQFNPWVERILWRRKWQPAPVFLPGKSHGQRSLAGCSPWGHRVGHG